MASISFRACSGAATIREQRLFESGIYSVIYVTCTDTIATRLLLNATNKTSSNWWVESILVGVQHCFVRNAMLNHCFNITNATLSNATRHSRRRVHRCIVNLAFTLSFTQSTELPDMQYLYPITVSSCTTGSPMCPI